MTLTVYGLLNSGCTQRVLTTLHEKEVPYKLEIVDLFKGEQKSAAHLARNPFGKIPVLDDDGFLVFESRAICKYIAKKFAAQGTKLMPDDGDIQAYGLFEQAASIEDHYFDPHAFGIASEKHFKKLLGRAMDEDALKEHVENLDSVLSIYDDILGKKKFLAGSEVTVADIYHLPLIQVHQDVGYTGLYDKYPNVKRWSETLLARKSWQKTVSVVETGLEKSE